MQSEEVQVFSECSCFVCFLPDLVIVVLSCLLNVYDGSVGPGPD